MKARTKKVPRKRAAVSTPKDAAASSRFEADLITRGEAAELTPEGKLPQGATHAIVKNPDGSRKLKRVRFSLT
jgi:hypothetical protein